MHINLIPDLAPVFAVAIAVGVVRGIVEVIYPSPESPELRRSKQRRAAREAYRRKEQHP